MSNIALSSNVNVLWCLKRKCIIDMKKNTWFITVVYYKRIVIVFIYKTRNDKKWWLCKSTNTSK